MDSAAYVFPAVRGTQAQREYYISMVPLQMPPNKLMNWNASARP